MDTTPIPDTTPPGAIPPKKYIRTLEGDMEATKKGWTPNLAPLNASAVPPPPPRKPPKTFIEAPASILDPMTSATAASTPVVPPAPPIIPTQRPQVIYPQAPPPMFKSQQPTSSPIETYADDFIKKVKDTRASTTTILAAEQDSKFGVPQEAPEKPSRSNLIYIIAGVALLLLGAAGAFIAYSRYLINVEPVAISTNGVSVVPIFVDDKEKIIVTKPEAIRQAIEQSVVRPLAPNTVRLLYTETSTTTSNSIFAALRLPAPGALLRNVNSASSIAGVVNSGGKQSPFFILSVASYGDTFAGMLSWEPTMARDLNTLFPSYAEGFGGQASSTTTVATSTPVVQPGFKDEVVSNHDVRAYQDLEGRYVLMYGYWNQTTLIIARDASAFTEIMGRLATARIKN